MNSTSSLAHGDALGIAIPTAFAGNRGFQAEAITHAYAEIHQHDAAERSEIPPVPASTILPFDRDPDYVERGSLLEEIGAKLARPAARVALVGLGGVGKTQLAIEYAHRQRSQSPETWVLWLYATNEARFELSVRDVLDQLKVPGRHDPRSDIFQLLRSRLCDTSKGPWLLILDNADDARVLLGSPSTNQAHKSAVEAPPTEARLDYIPRCDHGRVLFTSRTKDVANELAYREDILVVEPMEQEQALILLRKKVDRLYIEQDALRLAQALDYMPLALAQAAAYICQRGGRCSIEQYLDKIKEYDISGAGIRDIDEGKLRRDRQANSSIMLTWQISFDHIRKMRPSASDLLSLMSLFDCQAIPEALLQERGSGQAEGKEGSTLDSEESERSGEDVGTDDPSERNAAVPIDKAEEYEKDVIVLKNYSLVLSTTDRKILEMYRLVQVATKKWLRGTSEFDRWASQFISNLEDAFPTSDVSNWATCQSLFPHTMAALYVEPRGLETNLQLATLLLRSGDYASAVGVYVDAERMEKRSLDVQKELLGLGHPDTLTSMAYLASTYSQQGRWDEAEKLQMEVLETRKEVLGEWHTQTLTSMGDLANMYSRQGRWEEAEKLEVEVVQKRKEVLGEGHPDTLTSMANLASTYRQQGRWDKAEKLKVDALQTRKKVWGEEHPQTLRSMANLASTYSRQGRLDEARKMQEEVMEKSKRVLGAGHPQTLSSMGDLALTYSRQGRWDEARKMQEEVMEKSTETLGEKHPYTLTSMENLATILNSLRHARSALNLLEICIDASKLVLGADDPHTIYRQGLKENWLKFGDEKGSGPAIATDESRLSLSDVESSQTMDIGIDYCHAISDLVTQCLDSGRDIRFNAEWDLEQYLDEDEDLASYFTLTGNGCAVYATSCQQYVDWRWGDVGKQVLDSITLLLRDGVVHTPNFRLTSSGAGYSAEIFTRASDVAISIVQTLAWLASAFRMPKLGPPRCSTLQLLPEDGTFSIRLGKMYVIQSDKSTCWHHLIPNSSIAAGFPVRMSDQNGLDIDFEVMLDLADILFYTDLSKVSREGSTLNGLFYSGAGRLLYPTSRSSMEGDIIMWHFDLSPKRSTPPDGHFLPLRRQDLIGARHVVGFAPPSRVQLGTPARAENYAKISPVAGNIERSRLEVTIETVTAQFGKAPFTASVGGKMKFSQALRATVDPEKRRHDQILETTERQAVILFDCGTDPTGWLVSQLSVILDLICYRIHKNDWPVLPRYAKPQSDGGAAAAAVLKDPNVYEFELFTLFENNTKLNVLQLTKEIYCAMSQRQILQELPARATLGFHHERLHGWDLLELADPPNTSFRREIVVHRTSSRVIAQYPSWLPLARHLPVYIGQNLGKVVVADHQSLLQTVTNKEKYLMANIRAMRPLLGRRSGCDHFHLDCGLVWERSLRRLSSSSDSVQSFIDSRQHNCTRTACLPVCDDDLIVFGPEDNALIRFNNMLDQRMPDNTTFWN